jgi:hypothetical protein
MLVLANNQGSRMNKKNLALVISAMLLGAIGVSQS